MNSRVMQYSNGLIVVSAKPEHSGDTDHEIVIQNSQTYREFVMRVGESIANTIVDPGQGGESAIDLFSQELESVEPSRSTAIRSVP